MSASFRLSCWFPFISVLELAGVHGGKICLTTMLSTTAAGGQRASRDSRVPYAGLIVGGSHWVDQMLPSVLYTAKTFRVSSTHRGVGTRGWVKGAGKIPRSQECECRSLSAWSLSSPTPVKAKHPPTPLLSAPWQPRLTRFVGV